MEPHVPRRRIYVDTSVFGGVFDAEFSEASIRFFHEGRAGRFTLLVSDVVLGEILDAPARVRGHFFGLPAAIMEHADLTERAITLKDRYLAEGILGPGQHADAHHVAIATAAEADVLVSWNFRHMVNLARIERYNVANLAMGHKTIEIRTPREVVDAD